MHENASTSRKEERLNIYDRLGGIVDRVFLTVPRILDPLRPVSQTDRETYERQVDFYFDQGYVQEPGKFFALPEGIPDWEIVESTSFLDGKRTLLAFTSGYVPQNPLIRDEYLSFEQNQKAYLVKWTHGDRGRKTVLCLHGYMLGDPDQAQRMFRIKKLYNMGLDVALFITPFHWRRAPESRLQRGIFLQPDNVPMTCECFGQTMHDLYQSICLLKEQGASRIGVVGASLGGYNAALISCLTDKIDFSTLVVPAVKFNTRNFSPRAGKYSFAIGSELMQKLNAVWELHSPLNFYPRISRERILVIASKGDKLCPFGNVFSLCQKWGWPRHLFMDGGHWLVFGARERGRMWYRFLSEMGFGC